LDRKKMPAPQAAQEQHQGEHHRADTDNEDQMDEISVIFKGSLSITSKTQGKKLEKEISLAQRIEQGRWLPVGSSGNGNFHQS
jgi:ATP-dependent protease ClpP protease subunit